MSDLVGFHRIGFLVSLLICIMIPLTRCDPPRFPRCSPGAVCDRQQDPAYPEGQGSGRRDPRGPVLPDQEGRQHQETYGEKQEG